VDEDRQKLEGRESEGQEMRVEVELENEEQE
jgi:hypothetical protein